MWTILTPLTASKKAGYCCFHFVESAKVVQNLSPMGDIPAIERQVRPLEEG